MRVLGIDFGTKRVGVAVSDPDQRIATPLDTVNTADAVAFISRYVKENKAYRLAIGKPLNLDGGDTDATVPLQRFVNQLQTAIPALRISYIDERYTSKMAQDALIQGGASKKQRQNKALKDQIAATLILQSYLRQCPAVLHDIQLYGQSVLRKATQPIQNTNTPEFQSLIESMFRTMYHAKGIGLAAPQIGYGCQLFVVGCEGPNKTWYEGVFINPRVSFVDEESMSFEEGCLSLPDIRSPIDRPVRVRVQYQNADGSHSDDIFDGLLARIIQHEYDHLHGKLFIDYLSPLKRHLLKKKLQYLESLGSTHGTATA